MSKKKLYYLPGLISLMGLPVLLFFWGPKDRPYYHVVKLNLASSARDTPGIEKFTEDYVRKYAKTKKITTIKLEGYAWDAQAFSYKENYSTINDALDQLQSVHDTFSVVKVQISNQNFYSDFVWLNNEAMIHTYKRYAFVDNDFYYFPNPPPVEQEAFVPDLYIENPTWKEPSRWQKFKNKCSYQYYNTKEWVIGWTEYLFYDQLQNRLIAIGFMLLILVPGMLTIRKFIKNTRLYISRPAYLVQD